MITLKDIIQDSGVVKVSGPLGIPVSSITGDSRKVVPGSLFVAVKGFSSDGHLFIGKAVEAGASAVVYESDEVVPVQGVTFVKVERSRHALAIMASNFYGNPSEKLVLVGITGTNGKTTTVTLLYNLFKGLGYECGLLSTIANYVGGKRTETTNTTSDPVTINSLLARMVEAGCQYCFMEVSSIGMEQERVAGLRFKAGIFSNLTHDHLDYHKTFAEYLRCKKLFFDSLGKDAFAIVNTDDRNGLVMVQNTAAQFRDLHRAAHGHFLGRAGRCFPGPVPVRPLLEAYDFRFGLGFFHCGCGCHVQLHVLHLHGQDFPQPVLHLTDQCRYAGDAAWTGGRTRREPLLQAKPESGGGRNVQLLQQHGEGPRYGCSVRGSGAELENERVAETQRVTGGRQAAFVV